MANIVDKMLPELMLVFFEQNMLWRTPLWKNTFNNPTEGKKCLHTSENKFIKLCWLEATVENYARMTLQLLPSNLGFIYGQFRGYGGEIKYNLETQFRLWFLV